MLPLLLGGIAIASALAYLLSEEEIKYSDMANTHNQFLKFEQNISVPQSKKQKLISSRQALQNRIIEHFKKKPNAPVPKFYIQGSYKMGTMILDKKNTYDVDLGIYFLTKPLIEPATLQKWVIEAVKGHTADGVEHRSKCLRVIYKENFDIDLPVYYKNTQDKSPFLATKAGWQESDPKELCDWFKSKKDKEGQLLRLVKYFKAWANNRGKKMPSGIALTVWVTNNYTANIRDDIAFYETAKKMYKYFANNAKCINPATPGDNLIERLDSIQIRNFYNAFGNLVKSAEQALTQDSTTKANNIWHNEFGDKFPML
jgi:hypothetical protein